MKMTETKVSFPLTLVLSWKISWDLCVFPLLTTKAVIFSFLLGFCFYTGLSSIQWEPRTFFIISWKLSHKNILRWHITNCSWMCHALISRTWSVLARAFLSDTLPSSSSHCFYGIHIYNHTISLLLLLSSRCRYNTY